MDGNRGKAPRKQLATKAFHQYYRGWPVFSRWRTKPHQFQRVVGRVAEKEENTWANSFHIGEQANMMC